MMRAAAAPPAVCLFPQASPCCFPCCAGASMCSCTRCGGGAEAARWQLRVPCGTRCLRSHRDRRAACLQACAAHGVLSGRLGLCMLRSRVLRAAAPVLLQQHHTTRAPTRLCGGPFVCPSACCAQPLALRVLQPVWERSSTKVTAERMQLAVTKFNESLWKVRARPCSVDRRWRPCVFSWLHLGQQRHSAGKQRHGPRAAARAACRHGGGQQQWCT